MNEDENTLYLEPMGALPELELGRDDYLFGEKKSFDELGVNDLLCRALLELGKPVATTIQSSSFEVIASGKDAIIAAETGSGKTYSYLLPLMHAMLEGNTITHISYPSTIILVPNKELCAQVERMALEIVTKLEGYGTKLTVATPPPFSGVWPYKKAEAPYFLICTPAYITNFVRGPRILEEGLFRHVQQMVLDEADMLLDGSYLQHVEKIMEAFKVVRRQMIRDGEIQVHTMTLQNILSAATLPSKGKKSIEQYINRYFPRAVKISNEHLHKHHPMIIQNFVKVPPEAEDPLSPGRIDMILDIIQKTAEKEDPTDGTMVFVNTADDASLMTSRLRARGLSCAEFHKLLSKPEKEEQLQSFKEGKLPVLVCTDHASRGLDLPNVRHVIQASFAENVVQHQHRIGRASRAGKRGRATNLYDERSRELVESILSEAGGKGIDQSFSRRRGFRQRIKRSLQGNETVSGVDFDESDKGLDEE